MTDNRSVPTDLVVRELLVDLEWSYPPADAIRATWLPDAWRGPARCPNCFAEWTVERVHFKDCRLKKMINNV